MSVYRRYENGVIHAQDEFGRTFEADNLDDAGSFEYISEDEFRMADPKDLCQRCFPTVAATPDAASTDEAPDGDIAETTTGTY